MKAECVIGIMLIAGIAVMVLSGCSTLSEWAAKEPEAVEFVMERGTREILEDRGDSIDSSDSCTKEKP